MKFGTFSAVLLLLLFINACGGSRNASIVQTDSPELSPLAVEAPLPDALAAGLPELSGLADQMRSSSDAAADYLRTGSQIAAPALKSNADIDVTTLQMKPNWDLQAVPPTRDSAWAIYQFSVADFLRDPTLDFIWDGARPDSTEYFIGVSNFTTMRWNWYKGPVGNVVDFGTLGDAFSANDNVYFTVLLTGKGTFILERLRLGGNLPPEPSFIPDQTSGQAPLFVNLDASASSDPDGFIESYEWDFEGSGYFYRSFGSNPAWTFDHHGEYNCTLRAIDNEGGIAETSVLISIARVDGNSDPTADLQADVLSGPVALMVNFDASASSDPDGTIGNWRYDFDNDGYHESYGVPMQEHIFTAAGTYTVSVMVIDNQGSFATATQEIVVEPVTGTDPPTAELKVDYWYLPVNNLRHMDASGSSDPDNDIVKYEWDMEGDGIFDFDTFPEPFADVTFSQLDETLNATVRVTDSGGRSSIASVSIVSGNPVAYAESEPNDEPLEANSFGGFLNYASRLKGWQGRLDGGSDPVDWYVFEADRAAEISIYAAFTNASANIDLELYAAANLSSSIASSESTTEDSEWFHLSLPAAGTYYLAVYIPDGVGAQGQSNYILNCHENKLPVADISVNPTIGLIPFPITLDASGSTDADGTIIDWWFDLDGDGIFEVTDNFDPVYMGQFTESGIRDVGVLVFDDTGDYTTATVQVEGLI